MIGRGVSSAGGLPDRAPPQSDWPPFRMDQEVPEVREHIQVDKICFTWSSQIKVWWERKKIRSWTSKRLFWRCDNGLKRRPSLLFRNSTIDEAVLFKISFPCCRFETRHLNSVQLLQPIVKRIKVKFCFRGIGFLRKNFWHSFTGPQKNHDNLKNDTNLEEKRTKVTPYFSFVRRTHMQLFKNCCYTKKFDFFTQKRARLDWFPFWRADPVSLSSLFDRIDIILNLDIDNSLKYFLHKVRTPFTNTTLILFSLTI